MQKPDRFQDFFSTGYRKQIKERVGYGVAFMGRLRQKVKVSTDVVRRWFQTSLIGKVRDPGRRCLRLRNTRGVKRAVKG